jgi:hypothetical protein
MKAALALFLVCALVVVNANLFDQTLGLVNKARASYGLNPLKWDTKLAKEATTVASACSTSAQLPVGTRATFGTRCITIFLPCES